MTAFKPMTARATIDGDGKGDILVVHNKLRVQERN